MSKLRFNLNEQNVWITSDTHYGHKNICRGVTSWNIEDIDVHHAGVRDFDTLEQMNEAVVNGINNHVKENGVLIHLGDWSFGGIENILEFRKQVKCNNIYLILGNHDHHIERDTIIDIGDTYTCPTELFTKVSERLQFKVQFNRKTRGKEFFCSHYAHRVWDKSHHGIMHCFGHSHGSLDHLEWGKSMDVGIDCAFKLFGEYRPFNIREVYEILKDRDVKFIDHHNENTTQ